MCMIYLAIKIPSALTMPFMVNMMNQLKLMVLGILTQLGLFKPPPQEEFVRDNLHGYVLIVDGSSPSLVPTPVHVVTAAIKIRVPILQYGDFVEKLAGGSVAEEEEEEEEEKLITCTVCLERLERRHQIRELYNCDHVFHRECLDTWVDEGHVTCPLCRSLLLPPKNMVSRFDHDRSCRQRPISRVY